MILKAPDKFSKFQPTIERLYIEDETFKEIYIDYQTYLNALQFWIQADSDKGPARISEYAEFVNEMENELTEILIRIEQV